MRAEFPFSMHGSRRSSAGNGIGSTSSIPTGFSGSADNAVGLIPGERGISFSGTGKEVVCVGYGRLCFPVGL